MLKSFKLPELAEGVTSAVVVGIMVKPGDRIEEDQIVAELENEKATAELPVTFSGVVKEVLKGEGDDIQVGEPLLTIEVDDGGEAKEGEGQETAPAAKDPDPRSVPEEAAPEAPEGREATGDAAPDVQRPEPKPESAQPLDRTDDTEPETVLPAGPEVRRLARELGVDLRRVKGSGPRDRITVEDVRAHVREGMKAAGPGAPAGPAPAPMPPLPDFSKWGEVTVSPMSGVRRTTADVVTRSWQQIPHVVQYDQADLTQLNAVRKAWQSRPGEGGAKVTVTAMLLKIVAAALKVFPRFNCSVDGEGHKLVYKKYIHLAVAVDAGHGLLTPVIRDADQLSVRAIAEALAALSESARNKQLSVEEMAGGTFSISNLGGLGTLAFSPIVTWPQVAVLGVGKATVQPVWNGEAFEPRQILPFCVSYDHRANDGADAARFLRWIAEAIEDPMKIIMEAG